MAQLIKCTLCGRDVSSEAKACPGCGHDIECENRQKKANEAKENAHVLEKELLRRIVGTWKTPFEEITFSSNNSCTYIRYDAIDLWGTRKGRYDYLGDCSIRVTVEDFRDSWSLWYKDGLLVSNGGYLSTRKFSRQ